MTTGMQILQVPYEHRSEASRLGARWHPDIKKWAWHGEPGSMPDGLKKWFPKPVNPQPPPSIQKHQTQTRTETATSIALDIPFALQPLATQYNIRWDPRWKCSLWHGNPGMFPAIFDCCKPLPFSWEDHIQNEINGTPPSPLPPDNPLTPREHQHKAVELIKTAFKNGFPGFLLADEAGLGKTLTAWLAACSILPAPAYGRTPTVCIVCPLSVTAAWRKTIQCTGHPGFKIIIINYERLKKLFSDTPNAKHKSLKGLARRGTLTTPVNLFIWDECQRLRNLETARTKFALATYESQAAHLWLSATAGQNPLELGYLLPLLSRISGITPSGRTPLQKFEDWCQKSHLKISRGAYGKWIWQKDDADCDKLHQLLFSPKPGIHGPVTGAIRRQPSQIHGWPEIQRILQPIDLSPAQAQLYQLEWQAFLKTIQNIPAIQTQGREKGLAALTRFRQKASLLRTANTAELAADLIEEGHQVAISCQWLDSIQKIKEELENQKIPCVTFTGNDTGRENNRIAFQTGQARVILFSTEEGINLQANEILPNDRPRAQIDHDIRFSAIAMHQIDHRCHRNGKFARVFWTYATNTKEEEAIHRLFLKFNSMTAINGDDPKFINDLQNLFLTGTLSQALSTGGRQ